MGCVCLWTDYVCCSPSCSFLHSCSRLGFQCFRGAAKWSVIVHNHSVPGSIDSAIQLVLIPKTQEKGMASPLRRGVQSLRLLLCISPLLPGDQPSAPSGWRLCYRPGPRVETTLSRATADRGVDEHLAKARSKPCSCKASGRPLLLQHSLTDTA